MKKILLILLLFIYAASTFGMAVKEFYCCGKLSAVSISFTYLKETSAKQNKGCCKTQYHYSKIKDDHLASASITFTTNYFVNSVLGLPVYASNVFVDPKIIASNKILDPPLLHRSTPLYILICDLRV